MALNYVLTAMVTYGYWVNGKQMTSSIVAKQTLVSQHNFSISIIISPSTNQVNINMTGSDSKWYGIGFDSEIMNGTYSIICSSNDLKYSVQENELSAEEVGVELKPMKFYKMIIKIQ